MVICEYCGCAMRFLAWRGLGMLVCCKDCGHTQYTDFEYQGLEEDLDGSGV